MHIAAGTLGAVLYAKPSAPLALESEWVGLLRKAAEGDPSALLSIYDRTSDAVFTLFVRLTLDRELAEELVLQVYGDVQRHAARYSREDSTVLAWIMRQARSRAVAALRAGQASNIGHSHAEGGLIAIDMPDYRHILRFGEESARLALALGEVTTEERRAIEAVYFDQREPHGRKEVAAGMRKLARALGGIQPPAAERAPCAQADLVYLYALRALSADKARAVEEHRASCRWCRTELESLRPLLNTFHAWPRDLLRPPHSLRERLWAQISPASPLVGEPATPAWVAPEWEVVAPGISCKLLATDNERHRVSMLVRLVAGGEYPPHTHADVEELHLLDGELWIDDNKLCAGDYNRAEPGTSDKRVWSETGCACVLVTSLRDALS